MVSQTKLKKEKEVENLVEKINRAKSIVFTDFKGLNVSDTTDLRKKLRKVHVEYKVIKNNIINRSLQKINLVDLQKIITGPTGVMISYDDPITQAKVLKDFILEHENLKIRAGILEGKSIDLFTIKKLADLPSKEVLLAKVVGGMKRPLCNLVFVLKAGLNKLVGVLEAVKNKR